MAKDKIKNYNRLKNQVDIDFVDAWSKITDVSIQIVKDEPIFCLGLIPEPGFNSFNIIKHK